MLGILLGLSVVTAAAGIGIRAWAPGFDAQALQAIAGARDATLTSIAWVVTEAGSFVLLAPLSIAFLLLRRWKRPADDIALLVMLTVAIMLSQALTRGWREAAIALGVLIAIAVAWSRVYLGVHYPTDVAAGLLLGWSWALLVLHWARPKLIQDHPAMGGLAGK